MKKYIPLLLLFTLIAAGCSKNEPAASGQVPTQGRSELVRTSPTQASAPTATPTASNPYPWHTGITATVFWVGEPVGNGSSEDNALSAYDDAWQDSFGCFDDPVKRSGYYPVGCTPKENPFYLDVPYSDFTDAGVRKANATTVIPWASSKAWKQTESMMKNQWVEIHNPKTKQTCYGQIQDAGPYEYNDTRYVFGSHDERPTSAEANNAGMDVSPALRDCLKFQGQNNDENTVQWRFVPGPSVPAGPWKNIVTTSQVNWQ